MRFTEPLWDDENESFVLAQGIYPEQVDELLRSPDSRWQRTREGVDFRRFVVWGTTSLGLYLAVVVEDVGGRSRVVAAKPMTAKEVREYTRWLGR